MITRSVTRRAPLGNLDSIRDEVRRRAPILEWALLGGFRKAQRGRQLHCALHEDKSPSVSVRGERLHCFACDRWWDVLDIAQDLWGVGYVPALRRLAGEYLIPWPDSSPAERTAHAQTREQARVLAQDIADWALGSYLEAERRKADLVEMLHRAWAGNINSLSAALEAQLEQIPRWALNPDDADPRTLAGAYGEAVKQNRAEANRVRELGRSDREEAQQFTAAIVDLLAQSQAEKWQAVA